MLFPFLRSRIALARQPAPAQSQRDWPEGPVDIIVPVYRGLEETRACLESVWAASPKTSYRLVVINDASPEPELTDWLRSAAQSQPMTVLLENPENLGFVGTVNRGMALSESADVVLLNSDAEVANDWLDRLVRAAYIEGEQPVSTVTPFSNNATICSYPRFCEDNELPEGYDLARLDRLFAKTNAGQVVDIPTAIGFCMYIRRDSLDAVGLFDEKNFGKGYGEENDFCMRALKGGWRHVHALDVFAWHKGSVSFGDSQPERVSKALQVLHGLHPDYDARVHRFIQADPARQARHGVDLARLRLNDQPCILLVNHQRGGGTERHCTELRDHLATRAVWLMLQPGPDGRAWLSHYGRGEAMTLAYSLPDEIDSLVEVLKALSVARVHVHHWLGLDKSIFSLAERLNVPQDITLHDYYSVCPQITLTRSDNRYCGEKGVEQCIACLSKLPAQNDVSINTWRESHAAWLLASDRVLAPSHDTARRIERYVPGLSISAVSHPDSERKQHPDPRWHAPGDQPLRVAVIGALSPIKGADMLEAVAKESAYRSEAIEFRLFGYAYRALAKSNRLTITGRYQDDELPGMLEAWQPHVVWFPAQWPETYSYTLSTCLELGLPVVSTNLGAIAERLRDRPLSWILDWQTSPQQWCSWFTALPQLAEAETLKPKGKSLDDKSTFQKSLGFYSHSYLAPLQRMTESRSTLPSLPDHWKKHIARQPVHVARIRVVAVTALYWLREQPLLSRLAQRIPLSIQRRVKSFLMKES